jgi:tRNA threonylcarbamoyladenosine biosynthesis protein TsaB
MNEVYWSVFSIDREGTVSAAGEESVSAADAVVAHDVGVLVGTGFRAYPQLQSRFSGLPVEPDVLPHARDIASLAEPELRAGRGVPASQARPVYLRDKVTFVKAV